MIQIYFILINYEVSIVEEKEIMSFRDEDGNKVDFEAIAKIYLEEQGYLLLSPVEEDNDDMFAFRIDINEEGKEELNLVEDDNEFEAIKKEYKNLLY
ncbi:hypothetical protein ClosIBUN13A_CONTIG137g02071 [Clostridium sp. IBUN13A]|jgi:uncharacterized protein YrzB (UPF0473 family)|nr:DUF1292 domain-containing protein [Clostridium butyricum]ETI88983.1 MAG: hypothetical protein Q607_CBUC00185G0045 [Clostridium butyricum DORA_1]KJZ85412.1 hypothetical protein ClosIBUN125C_CONTIG52g02919 [Clostridium sp. IBUN125C]KJZ93139.1 hypothetical protein ClosIBUN62F_CONTIG45g01706 [Clostridium sp. IBUN62F]KJZ97147.1 hypothetical protein ClosIBUN13A_CONTIG137g02071 [Clostridium sp. IBUN13A]